MKNINFIYDNVNRGIIHGRFMYVWSSYRLSNTNIDIAINRLFDNKFFYLRRL